VKYVNFPVTAVKGAWIKRALKATSAAAAKAEEERNDYISGKSGVWSALKPALEALSDGKCWYTEAKDKASFWQVDHFRPKSVYPWLAFEWRNMRLAGGVPNIAKRDSFPLKAGSTRATPDAPSIDLEVPLLLDPTRWGDPELLTFNANGEPTCAVPSDNDVQERVVATIKIFELDGEKLCAGRRDRWRLCERKLKALRKIIEEQRHQSNTDAVDHLKEVCQDIDTLYAEKAEFTATAWACAKELNAEKIVGLARELARAAA
jgi:uncharacterized protein (TIGR02646 family)